MLSPGGGTPDRQLAEDIKRLLALAGEDNLPDDMAEPMAATESATDGAINDWTVVTSASDGTGVAQKPAGMLPFSTAAADEISISCDAESSMVTVDIPASSVDESSSARFSSAAGKPAHTGNLQESSKGEKVQFDLWTLWGSVTFAILVALLLITSSLLLVPTSQDFTYVAATGSEAYGSLRMGNRAAEPLALTDHVAVGVTPRYDTVADVSRMGNDLRPGMAAVSALPGVPPDVPHADASPATKDRVHLNSAASGPSNEGGGGGSRRHGSKTLGASNDGAHTRAPSGSGIAAPMRPAQASVAPSAPPPIAAIGGDNMPAVAARPGRQRSKHERDAGFVVAGETANEAASVAASKTTHEIASEAAREVASSSTVHPAPTKRGSPRTPSAPAAREEDKRSKKRSRETLHEAPAAAPRTGETAASKVSLSQSISTSVVATVDPATVVPATAVPATAVPASAVAAVEVPAQTPPRPSSSVPVPVPVATPLASSEPKTPAAALTGSAHSRGKNGGTRPGNKRGGIPKEDK